jgi:uncharacterized protein (TIGR03437 family)
MGVAVDSTGNLYIAEFYGRVRKVSATGIITTVAGNGSSGYTGDGGPATNAQLVSPVGVAVDLSGNVFVSDTAGGAIRLLQPNRPAAVSSVVNAASNLQGAIAPGEIIAIHGSNLGPAQLAKYRIGDSGLLDCQLAGTTVQVNGACAPLIYSSATQVAAIVPYSVAGGTAQVSVTYQGQTTPSLSIPVSASAPGVFTLDATGKGPGACTNQDGSMNTASAPANVGDIISCYTTGEGQTTPSGIDGKPTAVPLPKPNLPVTVTIGGQNVTPQYAGGAPGLVAGVMQINVQIPGGIQTGNAVPVVVQVGSASSQPGVTIAVR